MASGTAHATVDEYSCSAQWYALPATWEDPPDQGMEDITVQDEDGNAVEFEELPPAVQSRIEEALWEATHDDR